jgi:ribA/ribD-fused uncharacterized protein
MEGDNGVYHRSLSVCFRKTHEAFGGLSNMASDFPLVVNRVSIRSSEALYQACRYPKLPDVQKSIIEQKSPMAAKMVGKPFREESRSDWDRARVRIMRWCLRVKLAQNWSAFSALLLSTEDRQIVEDSSRDRFWGAIPEDEDTLVGDNTLGRLLTELREDLRTPTADALRRVEPVAIPDFLLYGTPIQTVQVEWISPEPVTDPDLCPPPTALWRYSDV